MFGLVSAALSGSMIVTSASAPAMSDRLWSTDFKCDRYGVLEQTYERLCATTILQSRSNLFQDCCYAKRTAMHTMTRIAVSLVTTGPALVLLLAGCSPKKEIERPADEVIEQTYKINPNASLRIDNPRGSVTIRGTDGSDVQLRAVKS